MCTCTNFEYCYYGIENSEKYERQCHKNCRLEEKIAKTGKS